MLYGIELVFNLFLLPFSVLVTSFAPYATKWKLMINVHKSKKRKKQTNIRKWIYCLVIFIVRGKYLFNTRQQMGKDFHVEILSSQITCT